MDATHPDPQLELLRRVPLFATLETAELEQIVAIAESRNVEAGTALTHEGRHEGYFFVIVSGSVRIERGGQLISTLHDGDFLGEISLLDGGPRTATAVADTACQLLVLTYPRFQQLLDTAPGVRTAVLEEVGRRLREIGGDPD